MDDHLLMERIKPILMITGYDLDGTIMPLLRGVKGYMQNAGISDTAIASESGIIALAIGTNDMWQLSSGSARFSAAFLGLVKQLQLTSAGG